VRVREKPPRVMNKIELLVMKIVTLIKEDALTIGGEFLLEKGVGMPIGRGVGGSISNGHATS
jgi:hypothetical protein